MIGLICCNILIRLLVTYFEYFDFGDKIPKEINIYIALVKK